MKILRSLSRVRLAALLVTVAGSIAFVAAEGMSGSLAMVLAAASLTLFLLEIVFGVLDRPGEGPWDGGRKRSQD